MDAPLLLDLASSPEYLQKAGRGLDQIWWMYRSKSGPEETMLSTRSGTRGSSVNDHPLRVSNDCCLMGLDRL